MIKIRIKTILLIIFSLLLFIPILYAENNKNFVSVLGGAEITKTPEQRIYSSYFIGQPAVYNIQTRDYISKSGFAAVAKSSPENMITFVNKTEDKEYDTDIVPVEVDITTSKGKITRIRYCCSEKGIDYVNYDPNTEHEYNVDEPKQQITFKTTIDCKANPAKFQLNVQWDDGTDYANELSSVYEIRLSSSVTPDEVRILNPDPVAKTATLDPLIETTKFSINSTSFTVTLDKISAPVKQLYKVEVSSSAPAIGELKIYNEEKGAIYYQNSELLTELNKLGRYYGSKNLEEGKKYNLKIEFGDGREPVSVEFTAMGGGVADILAYPSPFNPKRQRIKIKYLLADSADVTIRLYDKAGKIVCKLLDNQSRRAGTNEEEWDGRNYAGETLATGPYICEIIAKGPKGENRRYTAVAIVNK